MLQRDVEVRRVYDGGGAGRRVLDMLLSSRASRSHRRPPRRGPDDLVSGVQSSGAVAG
jgi:hypothetical protein